MVPIKKPYKFGYKHGDKTFYNASHIGVDIIVPEMTPVYAPEDGKVNIFFGTQGGNWLALTSNKYKHRFAHLKKYNVLQGQFVKRGDIIAFTGGKKGAPYSGNSTTPHVHWDVEKDGRYIDPLNINWSPDLSVKALFQSAWNRPAARGEELYFIKRVEQGTIQNTEEDLIEKMKYWYGIVYPNKRYSFTGNLRWQYEKNKVLLGG